MSVSLKLISIHILSWFLLPHFLATVPILYPLKTSEKLWFSSVFRVCKMGILARNGLMRISTNGSSLSFISFVNVMIGLMKLKIVVRCILDVKQKTTICFTIFLVDNCWYYVILGFRNNYFLKMFFFSDNCPITTGASAIKV